MDCVYVAHVVLVAGHMLVASIATRFVQNSTMLKANALIDLISQYYPDSPDFITAACWADDLKGEGVGVYDSWHFINLPYVSGPGVLSSRAHALLVSHTNISLLCSCSAIPARCCSLGG